MPSLKVPTNYLEMYAHYKIPDLFLLMTFIKQKSLRESGKHDHFYTI